MIPVFTLPKRILETVLLRLNTSQRPLKWMACVFVLALTGALTACDFVGGNAGPMSREKSEEMLHKLVEKINWNTKIVTRRANVSLTSNNLMDSLPPIDQFPIGVGPQIWGKQQAVIEIFSSSEKAGDGPDGWLTELATDFNAADIRLSDGRSAKVALRKVASGTAYQFIASGKYRPQLFTPSNALWGEMVRAHGVKITTERERLVGNTAGIVMKKSVAERLEQEYTTLSVENLIDAVVQGKLVMGYTNPYASSTGLNFLVTILNAFSGATDEQMLKPEVVSALQRFQQGVPFVAMTTLQMRESVSGNGTLDAFVMEYQTFAQTSPPMANDYVFIPFGFRHDNPLYSVGDLDVTQQQILKAFLLFADKPTYRKRADRYDFNANKDYTSAYQLPDGRILQKAQKIWKTHKNANQPITAIFLADVSGSMAGSRIKGLKKALLAGSDFISAENEIGLIRFNDRATVLLEPKKFDLIQKAAFFAAVQDLSARGGTAMYDGIAVSLMKLVTLRQQKPDNRMMLFILTDGKSKDGHGFDDLVKIIPGLSIPIYTIGYEADLPRLKELSGLVEASSINAGEGDVSYKIGNLLNAQM